VIDEADVAREAGKLISTLADGFTASRVPLGFRNTHMTPLSDGEALIRALASRGLAANKPVSNFLLALFHERIASIRKTRNWVLLAVLGLLVVAVAGGAAGYALQLGKRELRSPVESMRASYSYEYLLDGHGMIYEKIALKTFGLKPLYIRRAQTHVLALDLAIIERNEDATVFYDTGSWTQSTNVTTGVRNALIMSKGYISTCIHFSETADGAISTIGIIRKFDAPTVYEGRILSVEFVAAEAHVVATLSKGHHCNYRL
jgi:hypothetical protein